MIALHWPSFPLTCAHCGGRCSIWDSALANFNQVVSVR